MNNICWNVFMCKVNAQRQECAEILTFFGFIQLVLGRGEICVCLSVCLCFFLRVYVCP
jgi:hypothetical protein